MKKSATENSTAGDRPFPGGKRIAVLLTALVCTLLWGIGYPIVKLSYPAFGIEAGDIPAKLLFAGIRFTLAGALTLAYAGAVKKKPALPVGCPWGGICLLSLFQTVLQYAFTYIGLAYTTGAKSSILNQSNVFLLVLLAPLFFKKEKITWAKLAGCLVGFVGIVIISLDGSSLAFSFGDMFILFASVSAAAGYITSKFMNGKCPPDLMTGWQQSIGGVVLLAAGLLTGGRLGKVTPAGLGYLLLLSFAAACSYTLWVKLLQTSDVSSVSVFKFMTPIFGVLFSGLLLGESILNLKNLLSLLFVCVGIYAVHRPRREKEG